eukprot:TRINITY_DN20859_c0_g1_i10.p1 TRINITY_DN20859_c0_g1~~TRINITY_DN20859_c0_g1_i10.p1  ORF type:complete len:481 (-),score=78.55 TRINITY_DN20859_c0_g1_i10:518-1960(-)
MPELPSDELLRCPICFDCFRDPQLLGDCGHTFCKDCISRLPRPQCPTCRKPFGRNSVLPNFALKHLLEERGRTSGLPRPQQAPGDGSVEETTPLVMSSSTTMSRTMTGLASRNTSGAPLDVNRLMGMGLPPGLATLVSEEDREIALRVFLLDNSGSTAHPDGKILKETPANGGSGGGGGMHMYRVTRWEEVVHMAKEHARWNMELGTPAEFVLLNPLSVGEQLEEGLDFQRIDKPQDNGGQSQLEALQRLLASVGPKGATPLTAVLRKIRERISAEGRDIARKGQKVVIVIVTDGVPSGPPGRAEPDFVSELRRLGDDLPVHLVVRLCTDDDSILDFYNKIDEEVEMQLEVVDDISSEAREAARAGNRFFTYTPLIHKLREGGTFCRLFDLMDERRLEPMEVMLFCQYLCRRNVQDEPLPSTIEEFLIDLKKRIPELPLVYNVLKGAMSAPVLIDEVEWAVRPKSEVKRQCGDVFACFFR